MNKKFSTCNPLLKPKYKILFLIFCSLILINIFILKSIYLWFCLILYFYIFRKRFFLLILKLTYFELIKFLQLFFKQDAILLMDCGEKCELIDCYSMFEYLQENKIKSYYIVYKNQLQANEIYEKYSKNVIVINFPNLMHFSLFFKLLKTKYFLSSFGSGTRILKSLLKENKNITYIFIQHGVVYLKYSIFGNYNANNFDKLLVSNRLEADIWKKQANFKNEDMMVVGLPRWDLLKNIVKYEEKSIFIFFTWRTTFKEKDFEKSKYFNQILSLLNNKNLIALLKKYNIKIYYGIHHGLFSNNIKDFHIDNKNVKFVKIEKISDYVRKCNLLITDFSSISFDFLFQNKPVIYYLLDKGDKFLNDIDSETEDIAFSQLENIFNRCLHESEVIEFIEYYLKNDFELENEKQENIKKFFTYRDNLRKRIYESL